LSCPQHYALGLEAIGSFDFRDRLHQIKAPTLVIAGAEDTATTPADAAAIRDGIPRAELITLPHAAHLANVAQPTEFTAGLLRHLSD
jgi:pimeloyl-ACP methyl ester carboxylesterase